MKRSLLFVTIFIALFIAALSSKDIYKNNGSESNKSSWGKIDKDKIYKIEIKKKDQKNIFEKKDSIWRLTYPVAADVAQKAISDILKELENIKLDTLISSKKEKWKIFQVDETGLTVTIYNKEKKIIESFVIGKSAPDFSHTYIRKLDSNNVLRAKGLKSYHFDRETKMWRDKNILMFNKDKAEKITIKSKKSQVVLHKEDKSWKSILNILSNFNATEFEDKKNIKETSLDTPEIEAIAESKDMILGKLIIGKEENDNIYIKSSKKNQIFVVHKSRLENIKKLLTDNSEKKD